jgi:hypothetical protein
MLAGIVPISQSLALRVALVVQGVDVEFGESARGYQRFDIFDADRLRTESVLSNFPNVRTGKARVKVKTADASLLGRPKLENRRDTSND